MSRAARRRLAVAAGLLGLAATKGVALSLFVPPFHAPDEPYHFDHAQALAENGALPRPDAACRTATMFSAEVRAAVAGAVQGVAFHPDVPVPPPGAVAWPTWPAARATTGCGPASIYPPVWYLTAAASYRAAGPGAPLLRRLLAVRWVSVAWSCAAALAALAAGILMAGTLPLATLYALLVVLQPMAGVLEASANSESAAFACSAVAFAAVAAAYRRVARRAAVAVLVAALTVGVLSRPGFALALPTFAALIALATPGTTARRLATAGGVLAAPALGAAVFALSGGERTGLYDELASGGSLREQVARHLLAPRRLFDVWVEQYWGKLGWMDTQPSRGWYVLVVLGVAVAAAGLLAVRRHRAREAAIAAVVVAGTLALAVALYAVAWRRGDLLWVQGRHVLVLFPAHAYLLVRGLSAAGERLAWRTAPPGVLVALLGAFQLALVVAGWRRFYGAAARSVFAAWQAAWGVPLLWPAAAVAAALTVLLLASAVRRRPAARGAKLPSGSR